MDVEAEAVNSPLPWAAAHTEAYLTSDGEGVDYDEADSLILLYTRGRKSGTIRRVPVVALRDGDEFLIMASKGGAPTHPEWYLNLEANPQVWVRDHADFFEAKAATLDAEERAERVGDFIDLLPAFGEYEANSERVIPMVRLVRSV